MFLLKRFFNVFALATSLLFFYQCNPYLKKIKTHKQQYEYYLATTYKPYPIEIVRFEKPFPLALKNRGPVLLTHFDSTNHLSKLLLDSLVQELSIYRNLDSLSNFYNIENQWIGTINYSLRDPNFVIIHHTAQNSCLQTLETFTKAKTKVSAHYVICKDGKIYQMLSDNLKAWHAGYSKWGDVENLNAISIGIELDNNGLEPFEPAQIKSLIVLLNVLKKRYKIPTPNFIGHGDIAPIRKNDPSVLFPWEVLAQEGFGLWVDLYDSTQVKTVLPKNVALQFIGYSTKDTVAAWRAFKRHYLKDTTASVTTYNDSIILHKLVNKKINYGFSTQ